jgi:hypothetical protein
MYNAQRLTEEVGSLFVKTKRLRATPLGNLLMAPGNPEKCLW